jgi:hypothetical protein
MDVRRWSGRRWLALVVIGLMVAPAVAAVASLAGRAWWPTDDFAIIDLRVRDVFTMNTPLTGLYSRPGWNHPGPLMFWGIAPLSWVSGGATWATRVGGAMLQALALVWLGVVTARHGTRLLLAAASVTALTYLAANHWLFREPWNLHIPLPFFVLFLFLTHLAAIGRSRQIIAMSLAATVLIQTHISYTLLVVAGFVYALAWVADDARRARRLPEAWRSTLAISVAIWMLTWIAPLADVIAHWPGNLGKVATYFARGNHSTLGLGNALRYVADEFRFVPPWLGGTHRYAPYGFAAPASIWWFVVPAVLVAVAVVAVRVTRARDDGRMLGLAAVMVVAGVFAIAGADEARAYTFQWRAVIAAFLFVACVWAIAQAVAPHVGHWAPVTAVVLAVSVVAWGSIPMTVAVVRRPSAFLAARERDLHQIMHVVDRQPPLHGIVRVRMAGSGASLFNGIINELDRRGVDVRVDPRRGRVYGERRTLARARPAVTWYVTQEGSLIPALLSNKGARLVASTSPLAPSADRELTTLQQRVAAQVVRTGGRWRDGSLDSSLVAVTLAGLPGISHRDLQRLGKLNAIVESRTRCRCAVISVPA